MSLSDRTVGLIGLGLVGSALAERFSRAGHAVVGFDTDAARCDQLRSRGGTVAGSAAELAGVAGRIVLSLPDSGIVAAVLSALRPTLAARPGMIVIDTTTGEPALTAALGAALAAEGIGYLDATIAGSSVQVRSGEVLVIAGGEPAAFAACGDLFATFATRTFHVGPWGSGARMKLVVNLVLGLNRAVLAEGLALAGSCGLEPASALEILRAGPTYSRVMDIKGPKMLAGDFTPQARLAQHLKDVHLILKMGAEAGARLPFSSLHRDLLERLAAEGYLDADNSAIIRAFQPLAEARKEEAP
jgi:3-hydroxyisobutyrate dehydrogenase-like beta-hydroxyacid dehydrogenase